MRARESERAGVRLCERDEAVGRQPVDSEGLAVRGKRTTKKTYGRVLNQCVLCAEEWG